MISAGSIKELDYPTSLWLIVIKLHGYLQDNWAPIMDKILYQEGESGTLGKLVEFFEQDPVEFLVWESCSECWAQG